MGKQKNKKIIFTKTVYGLTKKERHDFERIGKSMNRLHEVDPGPPELESEGSDKMPKTLKICR